MFHIQTKNTIFVTNYGKEYFIARKGCNTTKIKTYNYNLRYE